MNMSSEISPEALGPFQASVDRLNAYLQPSVLRQYQSDVLDFGGFRVVSPVSGRLVDVTRSMVVGRNIAYLIPDTPRAWLIAGAVGKGSPLYKLVTESNGRSHALVKQKPKPWNAFRREHIEDLRKFDGQNGGEGVVPHVALIIGDANFAHHAWNELAALDEWLCRASDERLKALTIVSTAEPLGPLDEIFPRLAAAKIERAFRDDVQARLSDAPMAVRVGSRFVTKRVVGRICDFSNRQADKALHDELRVLLESAFPRVWISVRLDSRTADNLEDLQLDLIVKIFTAFPRAAVLLDGFSFPLKFFDDPRTVNEREMFKTRADNVGAKIADLRRKLEERLDPAAASRVKSISGRSLADAIVAGAHCDYYVCHAGTLQHKIGWFHRIPGFIHSPMTDRRHARYHAEQVEGGIVPDSLPEEFVVRSEIAAARRGEWNVNYAFADIGKCTQFMLESMKARLAL